MPQLQSLPKKFPRLRHSRWRLRPDQSLHFSPNLPHIFPSQRQPHSLRRSITVNQNRKRIRHTCSVHRLFKKQSLAPTLCFRFHIRRRRNLQIHLGRLTNTQKLSLTVQPLHKGTQRIIRHKSIILPSFSPQTSSLPPPLGRAHRLLAFEVTRLWNVVGSVSRFKPHNSKPPASHPRLIPSIYR